MTLPKATRLIVCALAVVLMVGCHHRASNLSEAEANEYARDLFQRNAASEDHPPAYDQPQYFEQSLYRSLIHSRIREKWREEIAAHPYLNEEGNVLVSWKVYSNGMVSDVKAVTGKEHPRLVKAALQTIHRASPFAPWPDEVKKVVREDFFPCEFHFHFKKTQIDPIDRAAPRILPNPDRRYFYPRVAIPATPRRTR